jgi:hypothetical protein
MSGGLFYFVHLTRSYEAACKPEIRGPNAERSPKPECPSPKGVNHEPFGIRASCFVIPPSPPTPRPLSAEGEGSMRAALLLFLFFALPMGTAL